MVAAGRSWTHNIPSFKIEAFALSIQADGKIVAAGRQFDGRESPSESFGWQLARWNADGSVDTFLSLPFDDAAQSNADALAFDGAYTAPETLDADAHAPGGLAVDATNGRIYWLAGNQVDVLRLTAAGAVDATYVTQPTPGGRVPQSLALDSAGRAVVAGITSVRDSRRPALWTHHLAQALAWSTHR